MLAAHAAAMSTQQLVDPADATHYEVEFDSFGVHKRYELVVFSTEVVGWTSGKTMCKGLGGELAEAHSDEEWGHLDFDGNAKGASIGVMFDGKSPRDWKYLNGERQATEGEHLYTMEQELRWLDPSKGKG